LSGLWKNRLVKPKPEVVQITTSVASIANLSPFFQVTLGLTGFIEAVRPGSVNEYQLRLGRQRQVWLIPIADERVGVQVKL